jgi:hypothetical protein
VRPFGAGVFDVVLSSFGVMFFELTRQVRDRLTAYASPGGVVMPGAAWLVTAQAV